MTSVPSIALGLIVRQINSVVQNDSAGVGNDKSGTDCGSSQQCQPFIFATPEGEETAEVALRNRKGGGVIVRVET